MSDGSVRVVYFSHTARLGGGERSLLDLLSRIDREKVSPSAVVIGEGELVESLMRIGVPVHTIPGDRWLTEATRRRPLRLLMRIAFPWPLFRAVRSLVGILRAEEAEIVHTNSQKAHWIGLVAGWWADVAVVWHFRDILDRGVLRFLSSFGVRWTAATIAISRSVSESLVRRDRDRSKVRVVYNGIEVTGVVPRRGEPKESRTVGMVAQLARWKGPEIFLEAAARVVRVREDVRFVLVGGVLFPESEGPYQAFLEGRARELGIAGFFQFTGQVPDARSWIERFDLLVHPPILPEPFGRVLVESMALGVPIVATQVGAIEEIVTERETGLLVPPGRAEALAEAILELLEDPERCLEMGRKGRSRVEEHFSIDSTVDGILATYRAVREDAFAARAIRP